MDLYYIDYISVSGRSWLHRLHPAVKMAALVAIIAVLLSLRYALLDLAMAVLVVILALTACLPMRIYLPLMLYPLVFLLVLFISVNGLPLSAALMLGFRVLAITGSVVLFLMTTSFPAIFGTLSRVLPGPLVAALFFTYRALFIISDGISDVRTALHLRGGIDWKRPGFTLNHLGSALGHFMVHTIDTSQRMGDSLRVRGFANRVYYLDGGK
jgi:energy-coupling factor transporter transmembrane protein EcfT